MSVAGYKLPFTSPSHQTSAKAPLTFSRHESEKVNSEVALLREKGVLYIACSVPDQFVSSLFLVPKRDGNSRPVINLKDLNILLQYDHRKYLPFIWKQTLLEFACLPFGLAVAPPPPRVCTKIMKPVASLLRRTGIRLIIF